MSEYEDTTSTKEQRYNAIVRGAAHAGLSIFEMLQRELDECADAAARLGAEDGDKARKAEGRRTGMAQAIAIMRSPYSWNDGTQADRVRMIKRELRDSDLRRRARKNG